MANGRVQLASVGLQDTFLTSDPQFTYFLKQYKRHTKFALETIDNNFDGDTTFGSTVVCTIPRKGDLIHTIYMHIELGPLSTSNVNQTGNIGYTDSIGNAIIEYADLIIGGQTVQRITGEFLEIYDDIYVDTSQQTAIQYMVGRTGTFNGLGPATVANGYPRVFIVPLPFYFYKNDSLAIPLSAISKQEVQVRIKLRDLSKLCVYVSTSSTPPSTDIISGSITKMSLPVEYVFVSDEELNYLKSKPFDYVISQLQVSRFQMDPGITTAQMMLQFVNPVKEMYFVIQDSTVGNDVYNFKNTSTGSDQLKSLELMFNGETRLSKDIATALYLRFVQPMEYHTKTPSRYFYIYSFSLKPQEAFPTGQVNMSRIISKLININTTDSTVSRDVRIYAVNYNILRVNAGIAGVLFNDNN